MPSFDGSLKVVYLGLILIVHCVSSIIVPEEIPTVLSVLYSNIPPISKGTDSRLGVGFRFGEHADFQVLVELGPQFYTEPIGNEKKDENSIQRRAAIMYSAMKGELGPYAKAVAKYQVDQKRRRIYEKYKQNSKLIENSEKQPDIKNDSSDWLRNWSRVVNSKAPLPMSKEAAKQQPLPSVNRIKVVNTQNSSDHREKNNEKNDLSILKQLFSANGNKTQSIV